MSDLATALAVYDADLTSCPFNGKGRAPPINKPCPRCGASRTEGCGIIDAAAHKFVRTVREIVARDSGEAEQAPKGNHP